LEKETFHPTSLRSLYFFLRIDLLKIMASLRGFVLLFTVRIPLVVTLKTKDLTRDAWPFEDLFHLAEDKLRTWHGQAAEVEALVHGQAVKGANDAEYSTKKKHSIKNRPITKATFPAAMDWCHATVTSNLGGVGPDTSAAPELRYANIGGIETKEHVDSLDMVVTALSSYRSNDPIANGFNQGPGNNGCFGVINLDDSKGANSVDLEIKFVNSGTDDLVTVENFEFLLYDIDMGAKHTAIESLTIYNDVFKYYKSSTAKFKETGTLSDSSGVTFTATTVGDGLDNPTDPDDLTPDQVDKTFIGVYKNVQKFRFSFAVTGGKGGRNFLFAGRSVPEAPLCKSGDCVIWGDPHVLTFDAQQEFVNQHPNPRALMRMRGTAKNDVVNVMEEGQFWLVKSGDVHIQGRYNKRPHANTTVLGGLAVGGPFLKGNTFIVRPLVGKITWNGDEVLSELGSEFSNDLIEAKYHADVKNVKDGEKGNGLEVTLPGDVKLIVNRLTRGLAVKISMCAREWQDGQCGNFNGDSGDDVQNVLMERVQPLRHREALPWREHLHQA